MNKKAKINEDIRKYRCDDSFVATRRIYCRCTTKDKPSTFPSANATIPVVDINANTSTESKKSGFKIYFRTAPQQLVLSEVGEERKKTFFKGPRGSLRIRYSKV